VDELLRIYRIPAGGARLTPEGERAYAYGPPLRNPEVGAIDGQGTVFVTSYDRDRQIGVLYRARGGRPELFAGGTPAPGVAPLLRQPEGVAMDSSGNLFVADRVQGRVVKLDPRGRVLDAGYAAVPRARTLAIDDADQLWIGGDGSAERPWQDGTGQIWRVSAEGRRDLVLEGPVPTSIAAGPGGVLFVAQRQTRTLFAVTPDGRRLEFARFEGDDMPRALAFAPVTPETRRAGIAGQLFVVTFAMRTWYLNEVIQVTGPFEEFVRREGRTAAP
jgi:sugar lactone lactonase YvrE